MNRHTPQNRTESRLKSSEKHLTLKAKRGIILGVEMRSSEMKNGPGKYDRNGIDDFEVHEMFATEDKAEQWLIDIRWGGQIRCAYCESDKVKRYDNNRSSKRFYCSPCRRYFGVKVNTVMHKSKVELRKWAMLTYIISTELKSVSSLKLHRRIRVTQSTAWFMLHRMRKAMEGNIPEKFDGPVQVDETFIGGKAAKMSKSRWKKLKDMELLDGGSRHMTPVIGMRDQETGMVRATTIATPQKSTVQPFIEKHTHKDTVVFTDEARYYNGLNRPHGRINHKAHSYVDGEVTTNGIESLWSEFKRSIVGTFHNISPKHVDRYLAEFVDRHNFRPLDTIDQMIHLVQAMEDKRLTLDELTEYTGDNRYTVIME